MVFIDKDLLFSLFIEEESRSCHEFWKLDQT